MRKEVGAGGRFDIFLDSAYLLQKGRSSSLISSAELQLSVMLLKF